MWDENIARPSEGDDYFAEFIAQRFADAARVAALHISTEV